MSFIPEQGDIITLEFDPRASHEQKEKDRLWLSVITPLTTSQR